MKKSDLRTGMRITTKDGDVGIVMLNCVMNDCIQFKCQMLCLDTMDENMDNINLQNQCDIKVIEKPLHMTIDTKYKIIWERTETTKMSVKELEEKHGYTNLEIVKV